MTGVETVRPEEEFTVCLFIKKFMLDSAGLTVLKFCLPKPLDLASMSTNGELRSSRSDLREGSLEDLKNTNLHVDLEKIRGRNWGSVLSNWLGFIPGTPPVPCLDHQLTRFQALVLKSKSFRSQDLNQIMQSLFQPTVEMTLSE